MGKDDVDTFNKVFQELLQDLIQVFPEDSKLRTYLFAVKAGVLVNRRIVCKIFCAHVTPFASQILAKDGGFFLDKDYSEFQSKKVDIRNLVHTLKLYWTVLTEENKETLWRYFHVLLRLTQKIYS